MADLLPGIVESGAEAQQLATGFGFTEGPLWHPDGYWLFVDIRASLVQRMTPDGRTELYREDSGGSNGLTFDVAGNLVPLRGRQPSACQAQLRRLLHRHRHPCRRQAHQPPQRRREPLRRFAVLHRPQRSPDPGGAGVGLQRRTPRLADRRPYGRHQRDPVSQRHSILSRRDRAVRGHHPRGGRLHRPEGTGRGLRAPVDSRLRRSRRRLAQQQPALRHHALCRRRGPRRHESGRGGPGVLHRTGRMLGYSTTGAT